MKKTAKPSQAIVESQTQPIVVGLTEADLDQMMEILIGTNGLVEAASAIENGFKCNTAAVYLSKAIDKQMGTLYAELSARFDAAKGGAQ